MIAIVIHLAVDDREAVVMWENNVNTLLVLAGQKYVEPLKERGVFEYGIARMTGDPNQGFKLPLETRFLFEEIENSGMFDQMSWMSDESGGWSSRSGTATSATNRSSTSGQASVGSARNVAALPMARR